MCIKYLGLKGWIELNEWSGFPLPTTKSKSTARRASRADKNGICLSITAMIALAVQMANNAIDAVSARAMGMGPLTSISDVSDPYFVRS